jgi:hypothetical protein
MAEMPDVSPGEIIAASYTNDLRDRTVQRYANTAERDSDNPVPTPGDLAYITSGGDDLLQVFTTSWEPVLLHDVTGKVTIVAGRSETLLIRSNDGSDNVTHGYIAFETNVTGRQSQIIGTRGASSQQMGILFRSFNFAVVDAMEILPAGQVVAGAAAQSVGATMRTVHWQGVDPTSGDGEIGDMWVRTGTQQGVWLKSAAAVWTLVGRP